MNIGITIQLSRHNNCCGASDAKMRKESEIECIIE